MSLNAEDEALTHAEAAAQKAADDAEEALAEAAARYHEAREAVRIAQAKAGEAGRTALYDTLPPLTCLDAAFRLLKDRGIAIHARRMIEEMAERGLWKSPNGATPWTTVSVEMRREIAAKGAASRFVRGEAPNTFMLNPLLRNDA